MSVCVNLLTSICLYQHISFLSVSDLVLLFTPSRFLSSTLVIKVKLVWHKANRILPFHPALLFWSEISLLSCFFFFFFTWHSIQYFPSFPSLNLHLSSFVAVFFSLSNQFNHIILWAENLVVITLTLIQLLARFQAVVCTPKANAESHGQEIMTQFSLRG